MAEGPFAIRPSFGIHLQQPQVHPELDLLQPILAAELPDDNLAWLIIPLIQQGGYIETHIMNMDARSPQVNARMRGSFSSPTPTHEPAKSNWFWLVFGRKGLFQFCGFGGHKFAAVSGSPFGQ